MNVVFVCTSHLNCNSGIHTFNLANELTALGHNCLACVPDGAEQTKALGAARFNTLTFAEFERTQSAFDNGRGPDLIHAWTPREVVRIASEHIAARFGCSYVVHLEDNEEHLTSAMIGRPINELSRLDAPILDNLIPNHLSHPLRARAFMAGAAGVSALLDSLLEFKPSALPGCVFWPAADQSLDWSMPPDAAFRESVGIRPDEYVVAYTGNVHPANRGEVASLYLAIALLNRKGLKVRLLRTGQDHTPLFDEQGTGQIAPSVIELGFISRADVPRVLSIADALVQPGKSDPFNDYRFPSKLPEFFASGKPVVLPNSNLAHHLEDGHNCRILKTGNACEIAHVLEELLPNLGLRQSLGRAGKTFANNNFNWTASARRVSAFYKSLGDAT